MLTCDNGFKNGIFTYKKKLIEQVAMSVGEEPDRIDPCRPMHETGMDSLKLVELFVFIEKEFGVNVMDSNFPQDDIMKVTSLASKVYQTIKGQ